MGQLQFISLKHQPQTSFVVTSAVAIFPSLLAAASEEEENEEEEDDGAEMEELLWEGLFLERALFCAAQGGFQKCVGESGNVVH